MIAPQPADPAAGEAHFPAMRIPSIPKSGAPYLLPLVVLVLAVGARLAAPGLLDRLSLISFDFYQRAAPRPAGNLPIRIVDIDDRSLKAIGQWPWPRTLIAQLTDRLREAGAAVIGFDIDFAEPDRTSPRMLLPLVTQNGVSPQNAEQILSALPEPDKVLAAAMRKVPVVLGFIMSDQGTSRPPLGKAGFALAGNDPLGHVKAFSSAIANRPSLEAAAAGNGFLNQIPEWDHVVRRVPLILRLGRTPYPSLAAEVLRVVSGARSYIGKAAGANGEKSFGQDTGLVALRIGPLTVPTDAEGRIWLHFSRPQPSLYIPAKDILSGRFDRQRIADTIVLVGTSAEGIINDMQATPIAPALPGVAIHAQVIEQILEGDYLTRPDWALGAEILFTFLAGLGLIFALPRIGALPSALLGGAAVAAAVGASWLAFRDADLLLDPVYPTVVLTLVYLLASLLGYLRTETRQREIRGAFSRYMSPHYVAELARHPEKLVLGGEARELTIMFCDIRGFTTLSEGLDARALTALMNGFTSPMTDIITDCKGTIDKYIGDCIMAFWNAPLDDPDHAENAVRAAQAMRRKLDELNQGWAAEARTAGKPFRPLRFGIGINTGECVVGNFGSTQRFNYSLLGDPVNLASRLESLSKLYEVDLVIGEETAGRLAEPGLIEIDRVAVKGKKQAGRVFTIPPEGVGGGGFRAQHAALLAAYRRQDWGAALRALDDGRLALSLYLAPVYRLYRRRIAHFQTAAPPADWDGVYTAEEK